MAATVWLPDGEPRATALPGEIGRRLCEHFMLDEVRDLVEAIAATAGPRRGMLCGR